MIKQATGNMETGISADGRVVGLESWTRTQVGLESDFLRTWTGLGLEGQGLGLGLEGRGLGTGTLNYWNRCGGKI